MRWETPNCVGRLSGGEGTGCCVPARNVQGLREGGLTQHSQMGGDALESSRNTRPESPVLVLPACTAPLEPNWPGQSLGAHPAHTPQCLAGCVPIAARPRGPKKPHRPSQTCPGLGAGATDGKTEVWGRAVRVGSGLQLTPLLPVGMADWGSTALQLLGLGRAPCPLPSAGQSHSHAVSGLSSRCSVDTTHYLTFPSFF